MLLGAWCCGFLFYFLVGRSLAMSWTDCSIGDLLLSLWEKVALALKVRLEMMQLNSQTYGQVLALTLGDRSHLTMEIQDLYRQAGASHVLALSGMHIGIIYGVFRVLVNRALYTRGKWLVFLLVMVLLWSYALLTGCPKSLIRATLMISLSLLIQFFGESRKTMDILCVSAALVLLVDPSSVFDVGFQLSCAAMLGIIVLGVPLCERWIEKPFLLRFLLNTITISVAAQLATMPLTLLYFHSLATYSALTSILVIPLTTMILYASILVFCGASWMVPFLEAMISLQSQVMMLIAQLPGAYITF